MQISKILMKNFSFKVCVNGNALPRQCPPGLHFNMQLKQCDHPFEPECIEVVNSEKITMNKTNEQKQFNSDCFRTIKILLLHHRKLQSTLHLKKVLQLTPPQRMAHQPLIILNRRHRHLYPSCVLMMMKFSRILPIVMNSIFALMEAER